MAELSTFDKLTNTLPAEERAEMLRGVLALKVYGDEPLAAESPDDEQPGLNVEALHLGVLQRIVIFFRSLFSGREKFEILRDIALKRIGNEIVHRCPGLIDVHQGLFLPRMHEELESLRQCTRSLVPFLVYAFGPRREEFIAVLAGYTIPEVHARLTRLEDLPANAASYEDMANSEVRRAVTEEFERITTDISPVDRKRAYQEMQTLHFLYELCTYSLDEALECFDGGEGPEKTCELSSLRKHIIALDARLHAARLAPSASTFQALAVFSHEDEIGKTGFDLSERVVEDAKKGASGLAGIRGFNRSVPMRLLARYTSGDLEYIPKEIGGGEDWFVLLKKFWSTRMEQALKGFVRIRERERLYDEAAAFLGVRRLPKLDLGGIPDECGEVVEGYSVVLRFLLGLYDRAIYKLYRPLSALLEEGKFYKDDNRQDLQEVFASLNRLDESVVELLRQTRDLCTSEEEPGLAVTEEDRRLAAEVVAQRAARADREIATFVEERSTQLKMLTLLLEGILRGQPGQQYDTLANLDAVGEGQNRFIMQACEEGLDMIVDALTLLQEIRKWV